MSARTIRVRVAVAFDDERWIALGRCGEADGDMIDELEGEWGDPAGYGEPFMAWIEADVPFPERQPLVTVEGSPAEGGGLR